MQVQPSCGCQPLSRPTAQHGGHLVFHDGSCRNPHWAAGPSSYWVVPSRTTHQYLIMPEFKKKKKNSRAAVGALHPFSCTHAPSGPWRMRDSLKKQKKLRAMQTLPAPRNHRSTTRFHAHNTRCLTCGYRRTRRLCPRRCVAEWSPGGDTSFPPCAAAQIQLIGIGRAVSHRTLAHPGGTARSSPPYH